jgi:hypothetical protein
MKKRLLLLTSINITLAVLAVLAHALPYPPSVWINAGAALAIVICSLSMLYMVRYSSEMAPSPLSVIESKIDLDLVQSDGRLAKYEKLQTLLANTENVMSYIERGLNADPQGGSVRNFRSLSNVRGEGMHETQFRITPEREYEVFFDSIPLRGQTFERQISCEFIDSFLKEEEWFSLFFSREVRKIDVTIRFPKNRPLKTATLYVLDQYSNYRYENPPFTCNDDKTSLHFTITNPKLGTRFKIVWTW